MVDNLSRGSKLLVDSLEHAASESFDSYRCDCSSPVPAFSFYNVDLSSEQGVDILTEIFLNSSFDLIFHFAALTFPPESVVLPLIYFHNIVGGTNNLLRAMERASIPVGRLIFSSTCAVYGDQYKPLNDPASVFLPLKEDAPLKPNSPYGVAKLQAEQQIAAFSRFRNSIQRKPFRFASLRYFNVIGSDSKLRLGFVPLAGFSYRRL